MFGPKEIYVSPEAAAKGDHPLWEHVGKVHDWRNHVPEAVRKIWHTFTPEQRDVIAGWADGLASDEEWE